MKRHAQNIYLTIVALVFSLVLLQGCLIGQHSRIAALNPAIDSQAVDVIAFARAHSQHDESSITAFDLARGKRQWSAALAVWPIVQHDALAGIDAGPESEGVKDSFREQVNRLDSSLRKQVASAQ